MKIKFQNILLVGALALSSVSCKKEFYDEDVIIDPNSSSAASVLTNATRAQVNQLAIGLQSTVRNGITSFIREASAVGREVIYSASTDQRYFTEILGTQATQYNGTNDPAGIFNGYYGSYSTLRRRALITEKSAAGSAALSAQEKKAVEGFCKTLDAYACLILLNMQGANGIRETFTDLTSPGDFLKPSKFGTYATGLVLCKKIIDEAATALDAGGTAFPFTMTSGWSGFSTVADFKKFNRAIAARIAMYQQDWPGMLTNLNSSFLNLTGGLNAGPVMTFSTSANDQSNGLYHVPESAGAPYVVFNNVIADAEAGDTRIFGATAKVGQRTTARQSGQFTSTHEVRMFASNTSSIPIIRNEELVLMYAEAKIQTNTPVSLGEALTAINTIRTAAGLTAIPALPLPTQAAMIDQLLKQRRYSLFNEGHRWFDMRRYQRLAQVLPQGTIGTNVFVVFEKMARPDAEVQWDLLNP
jgi:starch-binding outer membrane protein, SusD/RagB family